MSRPNDRYGDNTEDRQDQIPEEEAATERKEHAEERELPPEIPVEAVESPGDVRSAAAEAPGTRHGDQR
jgi:hypothetical protein